MARNEDEFEVMLGNKQLLSILFVLMVMFGIVFTMGYFVGRDSTVETAAAPAPLPAPVSTEGRPQPAPVAAAEALPEAPAAPEEAAPAAVSSTVPVGGTPAIPAEAPAAGPKPGETYIQVTAIKRRDAEIFVEALRKKGLPAIVGDTVVANGNELSRVLVGPYGDAASLARARTEIETLLKQKVFVRRY